MNREQKPVYVIDGEDLDNLLRDVVKSEFKAFEKKFKSSSRILTREQAGQIIGVSKNTVSEYVRKGLIPNRGIGHRILILESDLEKIPTKYGRNILN